MPTNIGVAKRILSELLGLSPKTMDKVIRQIQASGDTLDIQTNNIRNRIGPQSLAMIMKGMDASGSIGDYEDEDGEGDDEGDDEYRGDGSTKEFGGDTGRDADSGYEDRAEDDEGDAKDQMDLEDEWGFEDDLHGEEEAPEMPGFSGTRDKLDALSVRKESIKFSLKDYLINEDNMVNIDLSDPNAAQQEIRKLSRMAKASPDRVRRQQQLDINDEKKDAQTNDGPTKSLDQQIAMTKQKLLQMNKRRSDITKRSGEAV